MKHIHVINDRDRAIYLLRLLKNLKPLQTKRHQEFLKRLKKDDWAKIGFVDFDRMVKDDLEGMLSGAVEIVSPFEMEAHINPATDDYGRYLTGEPAKSIEVWRGGKRLFKIVDIESVSAGREIKRMLEGCGVKVIPE